MSRISSMTIGLVLIFIGAQLYLVKSYLLTPTATRFVQEHFSSNNDSMFTNPGVQTNGWLSDTNSNNAWNTNRNNNGGLWGSNTDGANAGSIGQAPAGQKWPYYRTDNAGYNSNGVTNRGGPFSNSSFQQPPAAVNQFGVNTAGNSAIFGPGKRFVPPRWIMWPALFLGAVFFLHGAALRR